MAKIMISSTSEDLVEYRKRLMDTLRLLKQDGIGMEYFGADPDTPVDVCMRNVDSADLVILVVAHRYGWVPTKEEGGDGVRSITRMEFERAIHPPNGAKPKPVLAFFVDMKAPWTQRREHDRLLDAKSNDEALKVFEAVKALNDFKDYVQNGKLVRDTFSSETDLANKAGAAVANWLLKQQKAKEDDVIAQRALQELMAKVATSLAQGLPDLALTYLENGAKSADQANLATIADKRLEIAIANLPICAERRMSAAQEVLAHGGKQSALASLALGKCKSQRARETWKKNRELAWTLAMEAHDHLKASADADALNPDTFGTLGGLLKRMAEWAPEISPAHAPELEDAMLAAYKSGWDSTPHAYPLLNYLEQRAKLAQKRKPRPEGYPLLREEERDLRSALGRALKIRETQLSNRQDRPWAAFDIARGRHYLNPNVPAFLEDLQNAVEEARSIALEPEDRYMVTTTSDSLRSLIAAKVKLEGLSEGIELLDLAVQYDDWYLGPPKRPAQYLERELLDLRASVAEALQKQTALTTAQAAEIAKFIQASELRWSREDEAQFQAELVQWKKDLEPRDLKIMRGLWKIFGGKAVDAVAGGIPVDWSAAAEVASAMLGRKSAL